MQPKCCAAGGEGRCCLSSGWLWGNLRRWSTCAMRSGNSSARPRIRSGNRLLSHRRSTSLSFRSQCDDQLRARVAHAVHLGLWDLSRNTHYRLPLGHRASACDCWRQSRPNPTSIRYWVPDGSPTMVVSCMPFSSSTSIRSISSAWA